MTNDQHPRPPRRTRYAVLSWLAARCLLVQPGCGDPLRQALEGIVTLDGQPLDEGNVTFLPHPGTAGPTAGGQINDGKFSIHPAEGTFAGEFRVEISARRSTGQRVYDAETRQEIELVEQFLPARYNTHSELEASVKAGEVNRFEFALESE